LFLTNENAMTVVFRFYFISSKKAHNYEESNT